MKNAFLLTIVAIAICACGNTNSEDSEHYEQVKSTHVDSTNIYGTAPAQYGNTNPADTTSKLPTGDDTGRRANTDQK